MHCLLKNLLPAVYVCAFSVIGIPNRSAFDHDFMFVLAEISSKFPLLYYVLEISPIMHAGIMLHAFQPLLCLKSLCQHNRLELKPNLEEKSGTQAGVGCIAANVQLRVYILYYIANDDLFMSFGHIYTFRQLANCKSQIIYDLQVTL